MRTCRRAVKFDGAGVRLPRVTAPDADAIHVENYAAWRQVRMKSCLNEPRMDCRLVVRVVALVIFEAGDDVGVGIVTGKQGVLS